MPVTEEEMKKGLTEACKKFKAVLMSQRGKEPYGNNVMICCKGFYDFCKILRETYSLMDKYADEHGVKELEQFWNNNRHFDMSKRYLFFRDVDRELGMQIPYDAMESRLVSELPSLWFDNIFKSDYDRYFCRRLSLNTLRRFYEEIRDLVDGCKYVFNEAKKLVKDGDPELNKHFKASYLPKLEIIKKNLSDVTQNPSEITPVLFERYVKILERDLRPVADYAIWLSDHLPDFRHNPRHSSVKHEKDRLYDCYDSTMSEIRRFFESTKKRYDVVLSGWIQNLDVLMKGLANWKPIDSK